MQEQFQTSSQETDWERLRPVLDALMLELKETVREALLLRYFEKCSLADVGGKLEPIRKGQATRLSPALDPALDPKMAHFDEVRDQVRD
jgi:DNA-directed RNA polymerase specialized sigma24 family protein